MDKINAFSKWEIDFTTQKISTQSVKLGIYDTTMAILQIKYSNALNFITL